jgi:hypothetical protein
MWNDTRRFWGKTLWRSVGLACGCSLVIALVTINTHLLRSSLWFVPPGVESHSRFVTLGAFSPEKRFDLASRTDLRALDDLGFAGRYVFYSADRNTVAGFGKTWDHLPIAFVSDGFFSLLNVRMKLGSSFGSDKTGVVVDYDFWKDNLVADQQIVGKSLRVGAVSLPVAGVSAQQFHGLGGDHPALWLPDKLRSVFLEIVVQGAKPEDLVSLKEVVVDHMPAYHALVALKDPAETAFLEKWKVETAPISASPSGSSGSQVMVSFNRSSFRPAILAGIDMVPEKTSAIARYLWLLSSLSVVLMLLAGLTLGTYWAARTTERGQEIQARRAVGAHIIDLLRLFANEVLPFLGFVLLLSLPIAWVQLEALHGLEPFRSFLLNRYTALGFQDFVPSLIVMMGICALAVFAPFLNVLHSPMGKRALGANAVTTRLRSLTLSVQWALVMGVALLCGVSLLANHRMSTMSWGGHGDPILVTLPPDNRQRLLDALHLEPTTVATVETPPLSALAIKNDSYVDGLDQDGRRVSVYENRCTPAALGQLGIALRAGRLYGPATQSEAVISESYARALHVDPVELLNHALVRIGLNGEQMPSRTIVGVVGDVHYTNLQTDPEPVLYLPPEPGLEARTLLLAQSEQPRIDAALRSLGTQDDELATALRHAISMQELRARSTQTERMLSLATLSYSLLALTLLMLGIISEAQMQLTHRSRELALLVSLGSRFGQALGDFIRPPVLVMVPAVFLVSLGAFLTREHWLTFFPLLGGDDLGAICAMALSVICVFILSLVGFGAVRLFSLSLAELLRAER